MAGESAPLLNDGRGADPEEFNPGAAIGMLVGFTVIPRLIGIGVAFAIFNWGSTAKYQAHLARVGDSTYAYLYFAVVLFSVMVGFINLFPTYFKSKIMKFDAGNLRANPFVFHVNDSSNKTVVLQEEGAVGEYNRANRSLQHFGENSAGAMMCMIFAGFIFPFPVAVLTIILVFGRIFHQIGYATGGYGKHAPGFMLASIASVTMEGLVLVAGIKLLQ
ncbi:unnamed protein product [Effrenium voratum]|nr:unnamed protein product [Effrenium voratum]